MRDPVYKLSINMMLLVALTLFLLALRQPIVHLFSFASSANFFRWYTVFAIAIAPIGAIIIVIQAYLRLKNLDVHNWKHNFFAIFVVGGSCYTMWYLAKLP